MIINNDRTHDTKFNNNESIFDYTIDNQGLNAKPVNLFELFFIFLKIGAFTIGGGLAMLPLIKQEVVKRGWIKEIEFIDMVAISQGVPGPIAVNLSTNVGFKVAGLKGVFAAVSGCILPSVVITMMVAILFNTLASNLYVGFLLRGIRAAVTGIIFITLINMIKFTLNTMIKIVASVLAFALMLVLKLHPAILIGLAIIAGIYLLRREAKK